MSENKTNEYKREYTEDIKNTVVAFANTDGGKIYIGINDDGSVYGVENPDKTIVRITNMVRDSIRPDVTMFTDCSVESKDGKDVVVLTVERGTSCPYYLAGKGIRPEGVYVRQGASTAPASESAILKMIKETSGDQYEQARSINQDLTFEKANTFFEKREIMFGEQQKRTLKIKNNDGMYSNLGMLLSDQCVHTIKLAVFEGSKKTTFHDRKELEGSILGQLEEAYAYIEQYNHTHANFEGLDRIDSKDYPEEALREALLNAIVHRDYSFSGSTLISIFDDRIEIVTIGGLVRGLTFNDIMLGISELRNPNLANICYRLKLIEAYGTGIMKINESYAETVRKPRFEISDNAFKITLPNKNYTCESDEIILETHNMDSDKKKRYDYILRMATKQKYINRRDVELGLGVSQGTAILILREMVENGTLKKEGTGRQQRYLLG